MKYKTIYYTYRKLSEIVKADKKDSRLFFRQLYRLLRQKDAVSPHYAVVPEKRIAYLVNPKCACTSIKKALYNVDKNAPYVHKMPIVVRNKKVYLNEKEKNYFKFTFVRNPFKRIVSFYIHKFYRSVQVYENPFPLAHYLGGVFSEKMTFGEMVKVIHGIPPHLANNHFKSQSYIIDSKMTELDFIGKLENVNVEWEMLAKRFNLRVLGHHNKNTSYNYMDYYDLETLELVNEYYKEDISRFGYTDVYTEIKTYIEKKQKCKK